MAFMRQNVHTLIANVQSKWYYEFIMTETFAGFQYVFRVERARLIII